MPDRHSARRRFAWEPLLWAGLVVAARLAYAAYSQISYDDAYISLRYAANLVHGHGLVYNTGERVFGATAPLYVFLLAGFALLGWPMPLFAGPAPLAWGKAVCILADGITAALWFRLLKRETCSPWPGRFFALLFGLNPLMVETAISGMETSLVLLGMTLTLAGALSGAAAHAGGRRPAAFRLGLAVGLLGLVRPDALLFGAVVLAFFGGWSRRLPWRESLVAAACVAPWYLFAWWTYGSPLPNSIFAKAAAYNDHIRSYAPDLRTLWAHLGPYRNGFGAEGFKIVAFALLLAGLGRLRAYPRLAVIAAYGVVYAAFLVVPHTLLFRWYMPPLLMMVYGLGGLGVLPLLLPRPADSVPNLDPRGRKRRLLEAQPGIWALRAAAPVLWLLLAIHTARWTAHTAHRARRIQWAETHIRRDIGCWLSRNTPAEARVATEPIGYIGYYSGRRILDEVGLVSPRMIPLNRSGDGWFGKMVRAEQPDYVVERYFYLVRNTTLNSGVRMFATPADRDWFFGRYRPVKWYCLDLAERLNLSTRMAQDYAFVIFARRDLDRVTLSRR